MFKTYKNTCVNRAKDDVLNIYDGGGGGGGGVNIHDGGGGGGGVNIYDGGGGGGVTS